VKHIPNLLTLARLALAPYLFLLMSRHDYRGLLWPFALVGATDVLDGYLARRWHAASRLGAVLDPLADKILLSGTFLALALTGAIETWIAVVVLGRDVLILAAAGVLSLARPGTEFPPSPWGKLSTFAQVLYIMFAMGALSGIGVAPAVIALKWAVATLAAVTLLDYARRTRVIPQ
jgi:cardiolipin synthase (CMP-forming)